MKTAAQIRAEMAALQAALAEAERAESLVARRANAGRAVSLLAAMKAARAELDKIWPGLFDGERWDAFNTPTAWPRATSMKKAGELSDAQLSEFAAAGERAISAL